MAEPTPGFWRYRLLFVVLAALVIFVQLLPLNPGPGQLPGADILLLVAFSWTAMRPRLLPIPLLAAVFLTADILMMRPPGLWTALAILGCEFLRSRRGLLRSAPFPVEWALVAGLVAAVSVANALILAIFAVPQPPVGLTVIRMVFTMASYPLVMILAGRAFGLRKSGGDRDALGIGR
jgi:rod shape-determining protein MreD